MFSPFNIELKTKLETTEKERFYVIDKIQSFVAKHKGVDITFSENSVSFKSGFFGWTWDTFSQLDKGIFILNKNELTFKFYFTRTYIFFGLFFCFVTYKSQNIYIPALLFTLLITFNWLSARIRYKKLLEELSTELKN
jgi:hypothetical protein